MGAQTRRPVPCPNVGQSPGFWRPRRAHIDWIAPALGSAIVFAGVSIADKIILSRFGLRLSAFNLFVGTGVLLYPLFIFTLLGVPDVSAFTMVKSVAVGVFFAAGLLTMFWMLTREEVSRVVPVFHSFPIFVAIAAVFFLDESLSWFGWTAVILTVSGAGLVAVNPSQAHGWFRIRAGFPLLLAGAGLAAASQLILKTITDDLSIWHLLAFRNIGLAAVLAVPSLRPEVARSLGRFFRSRVRAAALILAETMGAGAGSILLIVAVANGPVSLASAILGTRPLFVFFLGLLLAWKARYLLAEELGRRDLAMKFLSAAMVVTGLVLVALR